MRLARLLLSAVTLAAAPSHAIIPSALPVLSPADAAPTDVLYEREFTVREGAALAVDLGAENVVVETGRGTRASVRVEGTGRNARAEFERRRFSAAYTGGRLTVRTQPQRTRLFGGSSASFTVTIRVPARFDVDITLGAGNVTMDDLTGDVSVDTGSGNVQVGDVRGGAIAVDTGSGNVRGGRLSGSSVAVNTGSGNVALASVDGRLRVDTGSGNVAVAMVRTAPAQIHTGSGNVSVTLPRGAGADLSADGGRVRIDERLAFVGRRERDEADGRIGRGGPRLEIGTGSGGIEIGVQ